MRPLAPLIEKFLPDTVAFRHELHRHPELALAETETARRVAARLREIPGLEVRERVGGTGIVAVLGAGKPGPCVALRADMDALPILEATGLPYASTTSGCMHACGHDGHTASLLAAARVLSEIRDELRGPVKFLFQPAEETTTGARLMMDDGALQSPDVAMVFGYHNWPFSTLPFRGIGLRTGPMMAASGTLQILVRGRESHAAAPHLGIDPVVVASHIVCALQTVVSRSHDPVNNGVVSITRIHGGEAFNIIPQVVELGGTVRALSDEVFDLSERRIREIVAGVCQAFGAQAEVALRRGSRTLSNHPAAAGHVARVVRELGWQESFQDDHPPVMGGEDFAEFGARVPGCYCFVGSHPGGGASIPPIHHSQYDFNDGILPTAIELYCEVARRFGG